MFYMIYELCWKSSKTVGIGMKRGISQSWGDKPKDNSIIISHFLYQFVNISNNHHHSLLGSKHLIKKTHQWLGANISLKNHDSGPSLRSTKLIFFMELLNIYV